MDAPLLKVLFLIANILASFAAARDPSKANPPTTEERLKPTGLERVLHIVVFVSRIVVLILPLCEILVILSLYDKPGSTFTRVVAAVLPTANASRITFSPTFVVWSSTAFFGGILRHRCCVILGHFFSFNLSIRSKQKLITSGPYAFVRHPSYTGILMMFYGTSASQLIGGSWLTECTMLGEPGPRLIAIVLAVLVWFPWVLHRMEKEDKMLEKAFGKEWEVWRTSVPCKLVPGIY